MAETTERDELTLKWGTLKGWHFHSELARALLREYHEIGASMSAMMQHDTPRQKEIICELIDEGNFETVENDWEGTQMSKAEAKAYVMDYGKPKAPPKTRSAP